MSIPDFGCRNRYAITFSAIRITVTTGNRSVGMLSFSGNTSAGGAGQRPDAGRILRHVLVGVVGAAYERPGRDVVEAQRVGGLLERLELVRVPVAHDRQVALGRAQVLADGEHLDAGFAEVLEGGDHLVVGLAEADHQA